MAIAARAGIVTNADRIHHCADLATTAESEAPQSIVITGPELEGLDPAQVEQLCKYEEIVFARTTPEQKLRIVNEFKRRGCVVAMTGDGVNDAPSLKAADCEWRWLLATYRVALTDIDSTRTRRHRNGRWVGCR